MAQVSRRKNNLSIKNTKPRLDRLKEILPGMLIGSLVGHLPGAIIGGGINRMILNNRAKRIKREVETLRQAHNLPRKKSR